MTSEIVKVYPDGERLCRRASMLPAVLCYLPVGGSANAVSNCASMPAVLAACAAARDYLAHCSVARCRVYCIKAVGKPCAIGGCESSALAFSACSCSAGYHTIAHGSTMGVPISSSCVIPNTLHAVNIVVAAPWGCGAHILPCWFRACPRCGCCPRLHTATASIF